MIVPRMQPLIGFCFVTVVVARLSISIVNNLPGNTSTYAYVTAQDPDNRLVLLQTDSTWYHPEPSTLSSIPLKVSQSIAIPLAAEGASTTVTIPSDFSSGRIWVSINSLTFYAVLDNNGAATLIEPSVTDTTDLNSLVHWGFVELSYTAETGLFVNLSYVDFVGLALGISLESEDGSIQEALGIPAAAVTDICNRLRRQASSSGQPWDQLCVNDSNGGILRVLSPKSYISLHPSAFQDYYSEYVDEVWSTYSRRPLTVNSQTSAADIFGCSTGPFNIDTTTDNNIHVAIVPRLCAALHRATLLLKGGDFQPGLDPAFYYMTDPSNVYSNLVHDLELDGKGYAFPYDDVGPSGADQSGLIASQAPKSLIITVGGPSTIK
ncbi:conserved hypothetical protein [Talaromyces stipitatus ATCC 10500]|uniref:GH64 domain-containing protein n=1 Tax=Talaromyces stipitatus (strain ATCC 10500 / CBS 375.48 / QM 6759 / NRRL 1006) TaxID=441959 RepID=B8LX93_TALSN|nr:uncharacterized protein TSTA_062300 [Talaromyces stipitatus ATCC 10500]EED22743.1 conserved hypothetical protein [Talaromyces stipitatus ATCC 10500]